jgi:hypothetical protein
MSAAATARAAIQGSRPRDDAVAGAAGVELFASSAAPPSSSSICTRASPMACSRVLASFFRQRVSNRRSPAGVVAGTALQSGSLLMTDTIVSVTSSPRNARVPDSISNSTAPNAQMSPRRSTVLPRACSGAM